jgi:hypothetical protein
MEADEMTGDTVVKAIILDQINGLPVSFTAYLAS